MQDTGRVKHKALLLFYIVPETQIKMNVDSYHQDAQDNKLICVPPSVKVSYLPCFISEGNFFLGYFWTYSKQGSFISTNIISSLSHINKRIGVKSLYANSFHVSNMHPQRFYNISLQNLP